MKGYKHLTDAQLKQVPVVYNRTRSTIATAEEMGVSRNQVRYALKNLGIEPTGAKGGACYRHIDSIRQWAQEGVSMTEMARRVGTTHSKVGTFLRKNGVPYVPFRQEGANNPSWRGGRMVDKNGYVLLWAPEHPKATRHGYVREHRLVMEHALGRPLLANEVVHHIDGDRQNNALHNLEVFRSNGQHLRVTRKGIAPRISLEGWGRIRESTRRVNMRRQGASQNRSVAGGPPSSGTTAPTPIARDREAPCL